MTRKRNLKTPAKRRAMNCGHYRFRTSLYRIAHVRQIRLQWRLAKFADVSARNECAPLAGNDDCSNALIRLHLRERLHQGSAHRIACRIDRRIVDEQHRNAVMHFNPHWRFITHGIFQSFPG